MKRPHAQLGVNLGQRPFVYDIDGMVSVSDKFGLVCPDYLLSQSSARDKVFKTRLTLSTLRCFILPSTGTICVKL